jgi:hypothetical protein
MTKTTAVTNTKTNTPTNIKTYKDWDPIRDKIMLDAHCLPFCERKEIRRWAENIENMLTKISMLQVEYRRRENNHSLLGIAKLQDEINLIVAPMARKISKRALLAIISK